MCEHMSRSAIWASLPVDDTWVAVCACAYTLVCGQDMVCVGDVLVHMAVYVCGLFLPTHNPTHLC